MKDLSETDPVALLRENVAHPFEQARAMPPEVYTSEAFLAAEIEHVFSREWLCLGRASALAEPGDYAASEIAGQPVAVVRDRDGACAPSRTSACTGCRRCSTARRVRAIVCPYHAWTYNLDGTLRGAPAMSRNEAFDRRDYRLPALRCEEWLGWVFVSLDPDARPVAERLGEVEGLVGDFGMEAYVETFFETHVWDTNWKVLAENFMESYHLPVCHAATIGGLSKLDEMVCPPGREAFNYTPS